MKDVSACALCGACYRLRSAQAAARPRRGLRRDAGEVKQLIQAWYFLIKVFFKGFFLYFFLRLQSKGRVFQRRKGRERRREIGSTHDASRGKKRARVDC